MVFEGASSGLLDQEDLDNAAEAIAPDSAAGLLIYENRWGGPFRRGHAPRVPAVASGRIPVQAILVVLDATEQSQSEKEA